MWSLEAVLPRFFVTPYCVLGWRGLIWQYIAYSCWDSQNDKADRGKAASSKEREEDS